MNKKFLAELKEEQIQAIKEAHCLELGIFQALILRLDTFWLLSLFLCFFQRI